MHVAGDGVSSKITEANYPTKLLEYATTHHVDAYISNMAEPPHSLKSYDDSYDDMQFMVWLTHAWINPKTGSTIFEEFTKKYVKNERLATKLAKVRHIVFDEFEVIDDDDDFIVTVKDSKGATYRFKTKHIYKLMFINAGRIAAAIHPWYANGVYKAAGAIKPIKRSTPK